MPTKCDFEEDAFQQLVDGAIGRLTRIVTTPGRVTENVLGYDAAFFLPVDHFAAALGPHIAPHALSSPTGNPLSVGITVDPAVWGSLTTINPAKIPPFRLNLFVQYKSPELLRGHNAAQWPSWLSPYYRFSMTPHQLAIMNKIDQFGPSALGCYCAPDFVDAQTLWKVTEAGNILDRAHFVRAQKLVSHGCYTYRTAKGTGVGFSEPEQIEPEDFSKMLLRAIADGRDMSLEEAILTASETILEVTDGRAARRGRLGTMLSNRLPGGRDGSSTEDPQRRRMREALRVIRAFEIAYRSRVLIVG